MKKSKKIKKRKKEDFCEFCESKLDETEICRNVDCNLVLRYERAKQKAVAIREWLASREIKSQRRSD